jgi:quinol monooxygenase YgiN
MQAMVEASRAEDGCIDYAYAFDLMDPHLVRVSERWASREALAAHGRAPHLAEWRSHWPRLGISDRSLRLYEGEPEAI